MDVVTQAGRPALTLDGAAERLGVSAQRVSQLLSAHRLEGPTYPGLRAPKHAERVWVSSLLTYMKQQKQKARDAPRVTAAATPDVIERVDHLEQLVGRLAVSADAGEALVRRERAARQVAHKLKIDAADLQDKLTAERKRNEQLEGQVAALKAELLHARAEIEETESSRSQLDDALTLLLAPDSPEDM